MAEPNRNSIAIPDWVNRLGAYRQLFVPIAFVALLMVIVLPLPAMIVDLLLAMNLALATLILLTTIFVERPLDFSSFPSLLLAATLVRLVLNIATTRLILAADAATPADAGDVAGRVIEAFAGFVAGNNPVVGVILFAILIIVQFVVITKGATRISEVAARFTLDAMPGKQMAIDADLNAGLINEQQAKQRREEIAQEADFYGAMDGAAKFVRGDAVAGIIITLVNIAGGFTVGVFQKGWSLTESLEVFTRLTIGDGLVSQIPAFVISIAAGLIVTRSSSRQDLGAELTEQLGRKRHALVLAAGFLALMSFTGLPMAPMLAVASMLGGVAFFQYRREQQVAAKRDVEEQAEARRRAEPETEPVEKTMTVDAMELVVGYGLVRLVDAGQGGDLLERISGIRRELAKEIGLVMPPVRIRDNMQLPPNDYEIKIRGNAVARGSAYPGSYLAMDSGLAAEPLEGRPTREPAFGLAATWIDAGQKQRAESLNYTVVDAASVLATHLTEFVREHASELLTREETGNLVTQLRERAPKLAEEALGGEQPLVKMSELQRVLQNLLRERVPIRDMELIVETLGEWATRTRDLDVLTEYVRNALRRSICNQYVEHVPADVDALASGQTTPKLFCVSLDPALEDQILGFIDRGPEGTSMSMPPEVSNRITGALLESLKELISSGRRPVVLASPRVRAQVRRLVEPYLHSAAVLGYNEVDRGVDVESVGLVQLNASGGAGSNGLGDGAGEGMGQPGPGERTPVGLGA